MHHLRGYVDRYVRHNQGSYPRICEKAGLLFHCVVLFPPMELEAVLEASAPNPPMAPELEAPKPTNVLGTAPVAAGAATPGMAARIPPAPPPNMPPPPREEV
jgi:hypothetical protein